MTWALAQNLTALYPWERALIHYRVTYVPVHLRLNAPNRMCPISIIFKGDSTNVFILENRIRLNWSGRLSRVVKSIYLRSPLLREGNLWVRLVVWAWLHQHLSIIYVCIGSLPGDWRNAIFISIQITRKTDHESIVNGTCDQIIPLYCFIKANSIDRGNHISCGQRPQHFWSHKKSLFWLKATSFEKRKLENLDTVVKGHASDPLIQ